MVIRPLALYNHLAGVTTGTCTGKDEESSKAAIAIFSDTYRQRGYRDSIMFQKFLDHFKDLDISTREKAFCAIFYDDLLKKKLDATAEAVYKHVLAQTSWDLKELLQMEGSRSSANSPEEAALFAFLDTFKSTDPFFDKNEAMERNEVLFAILNFQMVQKDSKLVLDIVENILNKTPDIRLHYPGSRYICDELEALNTAAGIGIVVIAVGTVFLIFFINIFK